MKTRTISTVTRPRRPHKDDEAHQGHEERSRRLLGVCSRLPIVVVLSVVLTGSSSAGAREQSGKASEPTPRPDLVRQPYSAADVEFMAGMIPHHAQAVLIAGWAASHGARPDVRVLCDRIVVGQRDE